MSPIDMSALPPAALTPTREGASGSGSEEARLRAAAQKLEASFLAEMLKSAGVGEPIEGWSGGPGEAQFASFLRQAQADEIAEAGGIGLAESIFQALKERADV